MRKWRKENHAHHRKWSRENRLAHIEEARAYSRAYYAKNPVPARAYAKKWAEENPERKRANEHVWRTANGPRLRELQTEFAEKQDVALEALSQLLGVAPSALAGGRKLGKQIAYNLMKQLLNQEKAK